MNTLLAAGNRSQRQVRAAVIAAMLAVTACFGAAISFADGSVQAAEPVDQAERG